MGEGGKIRPRPDFDPMRVKLFTFRYSATLGGFDEEPLHAFLRDKEVVAFREHFFAVNDVPHLVCVLTWLDRVVAADEVATIDSNEKTGPRPPRSDPAADLTEPQRVLYNTLREWRAERSREEGVPPYVLFNNRELVEIVRLLPDSLTALGHVKGVGKRKVERYGAALLAELHGEPPPPAEPAS